jgi:hypothetical protein
MYQATLPGPSFRRIQTLQHIVQALLPCKHIAIREVACALCMITHAVVPDPSIKFQNDMVLKTLLASRNVVNMTITLTVLDQG